MGSETTNSDKRCAEQITMSWMETVSYLILALCFSAVPWATRRAGWVLLAAGLGASVVAIAAGIVAEARLYPLTDLLVAALAVCGGVLLGRLVPARFWPLAALMAVLAALDSVQVLAASAADRPVPYYYTMFLITSPWGSSAIGFADLLVVAAIAEHYRRRGAQYWLAAAPGAIGLVSAVALAGFVRGGIPLLPFVFAGLLLAELSGKLLGGLPEVVRDRPATD
jgi:hypothetical protein